MHKIISNQKCANLCLKCTKIRLATGLGPDPLGELMRSPRPTGRDGGLLLRGTEGREGEEQRGGNGGEGNSAQSQRE